MPAAKKKPATPPPTHRSAKMDRQHSKLSKQLEDLLAEAAAREADTELLWIMHYSSDNPDKIRNCKRALENGLFQPGCQGDDDKPVHPTLVYMHRVPNKFLKRTLCSEFPRLSGGLSEFESLDRDFVRHLWSWLTATEASDKIPALDKNTFVDIMRKRMQTAGHKVEHLTLVRGLSFWGEQGWYRMKRGADQKVEALDFPRLGLSVPVQEVYVVSSDWAIESNWSLRWAALVIPERMQPTVQVTMRTLFDHEQPLADFLKVLGPTVGPNLADAPENQYITPKKARADVGDGAASSPCESHDVTGDSPAPPAPPAAPKLGVSPQAWCVSVLFTLASALLLSPPLPFPLAGGPYRSGPSA